MPDYFFFDNNNSNDNGDKQVRVDFNYGTLNSMSRTDSCSSFGSSIRSLKTSKQQHSIRFQIVIWYIGPVDVVLGKVDMRFRVTIFWNAPEDFDNEDEYGMQNNPNNKKVWTMHGRQRAYLSELNKMLRDTHVIYVPPVSILNAVDFDILGEPEVCLIDKAKKLFQWSCLYKASMAQEHLKVSNFPHDMHDLVLRFGVLKHRQYRKRWDQNRWKLALATHDDTQHDTIRTPHGLIVDHVRVPGFSYRREKGLKFEFLPLDFGGGMQNQKDTCLQVKLQVRRDSSYYDRNIIPLLAALNIVAISTLALAASDFGNRAQIILASSFVEIGIRMTLDSRLPDVGYQIKMQVVLNNFFLGLLFLVLLSSCNYLIVWHRPDLSFWIDIITMVFGLGHLVLTLLYYYMQKDEGHHSLESWPWEGAEIDDDAPLTGNIEADTTPIRTCGEESNRLPISTPDKDTRLVTPDSSNNENIALV